MLQAGGHCGYLNCGPGALCGKLASSRAEERGSPFSPALLLLKTADPRAAACILMAAAITLQLLLRTDLRRRHIVQPASALGLASQIAARQGGIACAEHDESERNVLLRHR